MRDHEPIEITQFGGLWARGEEDAVPMDHFKECNNIKFIEEGFRTRDGVTPYQELASPLGNVLRVYNYKTQTGDTLIALIEGGQIYHVVNSMITHGPILNIPTMTDFGFQVWAGRAYISPYTTYIDDKGIESQKGLPNEYLYVYKGDGALARPAGGVKASGTLGAALSGAGLTDIGLHIFGVVFETDTGYRTPPSAVTSLTLSGTNLINFSAIPLGADYVVARHIVASRRITDYNGDLLGYHLYFLPNGRIPNNVDTVLNGVSFFDTDLLEDASHLLDNFDAIPAGVRLTTYHNRLVLTTNFDNISLVRVSATGEPEAFDQVDGILVAPLDGNPITSAQEFRDILYVTKKNRTFAWADNGDLPSTWPMMTIDQGLGSSVHGIATVLESGGVSVENLIIMNLAGIFLFAGTFIKPELSYKIFNIWDAMLENDLTDAQIINNSLNQILYILLESGEILIGDYSRGLNPKEIKWAIWTFPFHPKYICITETNRVVIGAVELL